MSVKHRLIDIDEVVRIKAGKKYKYFPKFVINTIKKIVHEEFLNNYIKYNYEGVEFCENCVDYLQATIEIEGLENLPADGSGRYTFVSNHPLGAIEGVAIGGVLGKQYGGKVRLLVNDFLLFLDGLAPLCVPVNKAGSQSRNLPKLIAEAFESDNQMFIFPAGVCSRKIDGKVQDLPWSKTFITKSKQSNRDIVPMYFEGRNSNIFYRICRFSDMLKLKFNPAMIFLPNEMYKALGSTYKIKIGKPIPISTFDKSKTAQEWAQEVRSIVYKL